MAFSFCVGPANLDLELEGYAHTTQALAKAFCEGFPVRTDQDWWHARLVAGPGASSHRGGKTLALGPVTDQGTLVYPELSGQPLRHGAPRTILHGIMGLSAHFLRRRGDRLAHAAGRYLPGYGALVALGLSGAGKSTLTAALGGDELGDEAIALSSADRSLHAQACLVPGERLPTFWDSVPVAALLLPAHEQATSIERVDGYDAHLALANALIRLRGDDLFDDLDWAHDALRQTPVLRVGWSLDRSPVDAIKRVLDAAR